jgi:hypothetical protein
VTANPAGRRVLVTGSRDWTDSDRIYWAIHKYCDDHAGDEPFTIVHGDCPTGADSMADGVVRLVTWLRVERHPADWTSYGKRAGYIRNKAMVDAGADICLAFIRNNSRGATMCAGLAAKAGIPVVIYREGDGRG